MFVCGGPEDGLRVRSSGCGRRSCAGTAASLCRKGGGVK